MAKPMVDTAAVEAWAITQKRVTNGAIRKHFNLDEDEADVVYTYLKTSGIVGRMGKVLAGSHRD